MIKVMSVLVVSAVLVASFASWGMAVETKSVIKGSFRNIYPDAVVVDTAIVCDGAQVPVNVNPYVTSYQAEHSRGVTGARQGSERYCTDKSDYAIADNFEIHTAIASNSTYLAVYTTDYNIICFNLPLVTKAAPAKKK